MNIFIFTHLKQWCALKLQLWNQLEKITAVNGSVEIGYFPLTISLLGSTTFHNLTSLEFRFLSSTSYELQLAARRDHRPLMESLIDNLENVPALKNISLGFTALSLYDLDKIHHNTPNLQKLTLGMLTLQHPTPNTAIRKDLYRNSILVDDPSSQQQQIIIASARNLEVLDIELVVQPEEIEADTPLLAQIVALTQYMSIKYTKLRSLK